MQNKRNKRLLACFLTALGLSANSLNASAENGQIRENIKFYFNIGKNCKKRGEKADLDLLAKDINHFVNDEVGENGKLITQVDIAKRLYEIFQNILKNRSEYSSDLVDRLKGTKSNYDFIDGYPSDGNDIDTKNWLKNVVNCICNGTIRGGNFTVFRGDIKTACENLAKKLDAELKKTEEPDLIAENKTNTWSLNANNMENHVVENAIQCSLKDGHLEIKVKDDSKKSVAISSIFDSLPNKDKVKKNVKKVSIGEGISKIGRIESDLDFFIDDIFDGCEKLEEIKMASVEEIGYRAFAGCKSLKEITIPDSVRVIGGGAFNGCTNLEKITIPNSVEKIGGGAFLDCESLKEITIPDSVETIDAGTFSNCTRLEKITIPNSVKKISYHAFRNCASLKEITIPDSVETIEEYAFEGCTNLTTAKIAKTHPNLKYIEAVLKCEGIDNILFVDENV